ncbi:MAG: RNA chaperone Hfq [Clostridia bacterium]|nr:RNA chaperone Hfq [Clostridia bacterium]
MNAVRPNVQDVFLNCARRSGTPLSIFVTNGFKITGAKVLSFDSYAILIETEGRQMLVYKHAVSTIMPEAPLKLSEEEGTK